MKERTVDTDKNRKRLKLVTEGEWATDHDSKKEKKKTINMIKDKGRKVKYNIKIVNLITP